MNYRSCLTTLAVAALLVLALAPSSTASITPVGTALKFAGAGGHLGDAAEPNDIAFDEKHNVYLVVWSNASFGGPEGHTYGQFIGIDGTPRGTPFQISTGERAYATMPRAAYSAGSSDDVFIVVYRSDVNAPDKNNVYGQMVRYTTDGSSSLVGANFPISRNSGDPTYLQNPGGIAYNPNTHQFLVTWESLHDVYGYEPFARLFNTNGTPFNNDKNLTFWGWNQGVPNVACDPSSNRFMVTFSGDDGNGVLVGNWATIVDGATGDQIPIGAGLHVPLVTDTTTVGEANIVYLPSAHAFLTIWTDFVGGVRTIFGRLVDANGNANPPYMLAKFVGVAPMPMGRGSAAFNPATQNALLAAMDDIYIWGSELDASGNVVQTMRLSTVEPNPENMGGGSWQPRVAAGINEFGMSYALNHAAMWFERYQAGASTPVLTVTGISPTNGATFGGTVVTISGSNFAAGASVTLGGVAATGVTVLSANQIQATTAPASQGTVAVTVTNPGGEAATLPAAFTYMYQAPVAPKKLSPLYGTTAASSVTLSWSSVPGATYSVCIDSANNNTCDTSWLPTANTSLAIGLSPGVYYWQVRAISGAGTVDADAGTWWMLTAGGVAPPVVKPRRSGDFDGDGKSDVAIWRPNAGTWTVLNSSSAFDAVTSWSASWGGGWWGDVPVPGDYDGDGKVDIAIWRPSSGEWWILKSSGGYKNMLPIVRWGGGWWGDVPVPGDYDGDGKTDIAIWRPNTGEWWILYSSTNNAQYSVVRWGGGWWGDQAVPGDYDGDGKTDIAIWRPNTGEWWILKSSVHNAQYLVVQWGGVGDVAVPADYDGDGRIDVAIWRPSTGEWWVLKSSSNFTAMLPIVRWGGGWWGDQAIPGDYDGDGRADIAIWRPSSGEWWILKSSANNGDYLVVQCGTGGDVPVIERIP